MSSDIVYYTIAVDSKGNEELKYADSTEQLTLDLERGGLTRLDGAGVMAIDTPSADLTVYLEMLEHFVAEEGELKQALQCAYNNNCVGDLLDTAEDLARVRGYVFASKADILFWVCYHPEAAAVPTANLLGQLKEAILGAAAWWNVATDHGQLLSLIKLEIGDCELKKLVDYIKNSPPVQVPEYALGTYSDADEDDEDDEE